MDGDGDIDLVFDFRLHDTSLACDSKVGFLSGKTSDGLTFTGIDSVRMIDKSRRRP